MVNGVNSSYTKCTYRCIDVQYRLFSVILKCMHGGELMKQCMVYIFLDELRHRRGMVE